MKHKLVEENNHKQIFKHNVPEDETFTLIHSGDEYFIKMKEIIENAQEEIHLQTYIFEHDETGNEIANCLKEAARRNVKVYILLDAYGSASLPDTFIQDLKQP